MDFKKVFIENNEKMGQYVKTMKQMKNMDHKNIAKIFDCEAIEGIFLNIQKLRCV